MEVRLDRESCRICPWDTGGLGLLKLKERYDMERGEMPAKQGDGQCIFVYPVAEKKAEIKKRQESRPQAK